MRERRQCVREVGIAEPIGKRRLPVDFTTPKGAASVMGCRFAPA